MTEELITDAILREFLLGRLDDEERERIESLFLTDSQVRERLLNAEEDLIEDYLEDGLSKADKERFVSLYVQTDEQRRKLRITRLIKDWAFTEARVSQARPTAHSIWTQLRRRLQVKPHFIPIAVVVLIVIVLAIVWLSQRNHLAVERELAQLNSPTSLRDVPPQMISLELRPVSVRSVEPQAGFKPGADIRIVELRLAWVQKERYSTYRAEVRRLGDDESFTIHNLQVEDAGAIRIRLPTHLLRRGHYQIRLTGIAGDGNTGLTEEYNFAVGS